MPWQWKWPSTYILTGLWKALQWPWYPYVPGRMGTEPHTIRGQLPSQRWSYFWSRKAQNTWFKRKNPKQCTVQNTMAIRQPMWINPKMGRQIIVSNMKKLPAAAWFWHDTFMFVRFVYQYSFIHEETARTSYHNGSVQWNITAGLSLYKQ